MFLKPNLNLGYSIAHWGFHVGTIVSVQRDHDFVELTNEFHICKARSAFDKPKMRNKHLNEFFNAHVFNI